MKTDRELIELAARAAGLTVMWSEPFQRYERFVLEKYAGPWDPLSNDGDAFRLAVLLGIYYGFDSETGRPRVSLVSSGQIQSTVMPDHNCSKTLGPRATEWVMRAIVMAAADIGEQL